MLQCPFQRDHLYQGRIPIEWTRAAQGIAAKLISANDAQIEALLCTDRNLDEACKLVRNRWIETFRIVSDIHVQMSDSSTHSDEQLDGLQLVFQEYLFALTLRFVFDGKLAGDYFHIILEHAQQ